MKQKIFALRVLLALALLACGTSLIASVSSRTSGGVRLLWESSRFPIIFSISSATAAGTANLASGSNATAAITAGLRAWQSVASASVPLADLQTTATESGGSDSINLITMADTPANRNLFGGSEILALASLAFEVDTGRIVETDIVFNPAIQFSTNLASATFDLQSVATHELGHTLGANHTTALNDTMFFASKEGEFFARNLSADSQAFAAASYPNPSRAGLIGSISGRVTLDGSGVFGASVAAFNTEKNLLYTALTEPDGTYTITGPIAGKYVIYAEPLDGPVTEGQLGSGGFYRNLNTTFKTTVKDEQAFSNPEGAGADGQFAIQQTGVNFTLPSGSATLNIDRMGKRDLSTGVSFLGGGPVVLTPGEYLRLNIGGTLLSTITNFDDITFLGTGITIDRTQPLVSAFSGAALGVHIRVAADAIPGPRVVLVRLGDQRVACTGGIIIGTRLLPVRNLYMPYLSTAPDQFTGLALANPTGASAVVRVAARDNQGGFVFDQDSIVPVDLSIAGGAQVAKLDRQVFNLPASSRQSGSITIESDCPDLQGFSLTGDPAGNYLDGADAFTRAYKQLHFVDVIQNSSTTTEVHLMNVKNTAVTVQLTLAGADGGSRSTVTRIIPARGKIGESIAMLFSTSDSFSSAHVDAVSTEEALVGFQLIRQQGTVFGLNAQPPENAAATIYSAQLATGNFGVNYSTRLNVLNVGSAATSVSFIVFGESGQQLTAPVSRSIPAGGQLTIDAQSFFALTGSVQGSVRITGASGAKLLGNVLFGDGDPNLRVLSFGAALPLQGSGITSFIFSQVAQAAGYYTGLAFLALEGTTITVEAFRDDGVSSGTGTVTLATGARRVTLLEGLVPATANRNGGFVKITSSKPVIAFELFGATSGQFLSAVPPQAIR